MVRGGASQEGGAPPPLQVQQPRSSRAWVLAEDGFGEGVVGGKSGNLARLRGQLPDWVHVPASVALPFGSCERVLQDALNAETADAVAAQQRELVSGGAPLALVIVCMMSHVALSQPSLAANTNV